MHDLEIQSQTNFRMSILIPGFKHDINLIFVLLYDIYDTKSSSIVMNHEEWYHCGKIQTPDGPWFGADCKSLK